MNISMIEAKEYHKTSPVISIAVLSPKSLFWGYLSHVQENYKVENGKREECFYYL